MGSSGCQPPSTVQRHEHESQDSRFDPWNGGQLSPNAYCLYVFSLDPSNQLAIFEYVPNSLASTVKINPTTPHYIVLGKLPCEGKQRAE